MRIPLHGHFLGPQLPRGWRGWCVCVGLSIPLSVPSRIASTSMISCVAGKTDLEMWAAVWAVVREGYLTKHHRVNFCLDQHALQSPSINEEPHEFNKPIQSQCTSVQHIWDGSGHLSFAPTKRRLQHAIKDGPVILPRLGNTGMWVHCEYAERMFLRRHGDFIRDLLCSCLKFSKKLSGP